MCECAAERDRNSISHPSRKKPLYAHTHTHTLVPAGLPKKTYTYTHTHMYMCTHSHTRHKSIKRPRDAFKKHTHTHTHTQSAHRTPPLLPRKATLLPGCIRYLPCVRVKGKTTPSSRLRPEDRRVVSAAHISSPSTHWATRSRQSASCSGLYVYMHTHMLTHTHTYTHP